MGVLTQFLNWYFYQNKKQEKPTTNGAIKDFTKLRLIPK